MSEFHSLAYTTSLHGSSLGCDFHNLGVLNPDKLSLVMDGIAPSFSPLESDDFSTGYLEDALVEFSERSQRRRLLPCTDESSKTAFTDLEHSFWNFNPLWQLQAENLFCMNQIESIAGISDGFMSRISEEPNMLSEAKTSEETNISAEESPNSCSSSYFIKDQVTSKTREENSLSIVPTVTSSAGRKNKRVVAKVVYPFALVKPGGREGDVTLNDINESILMPPTRPVRHPVGDFACRPCVSPDGPGLSGKAVVALTRIHTQGRGTITIIRTKG